MTCSIRHIPVILCTFCFAMLFSVACMAEEFTVMEYPEDYPPVFFREDGVAKGIVPDFLAAIEKITGDTFTYVMVPFTRGQLMFESGEIDIEPSVNPNWRLESQVHGEYTIPYNESENVVVFPSRGSAFPASSPEDFTGKLFGRVRGFQYGSLDPLLADGTIKEVQCTNEDKLLELLANNRIDATIVYKPFAQYRMKTNPEYTRFCFGPTYIHDDIMMRFTPFKAYAVPRFNDAIRQLQENGTLERIKNRYR